MRVAILVCLTSCMLVGCKGEVTLNLSYDKAVRNVGTMYCKKHGGLKRVFYGKYSVSFTCRDNTVFKIGF